ncbi:MAG: hypothetical protein ACC707_19985, partial [Thiohalomonadales bacterium]
SPLLSGALALGAGTVQAADVFLCAGAFNKTMDSDGVVIPMWGFAQVATLGELVAGCSSDATKPPPTVPGPMLTNQDTGTGLVIHLFNDGLPENISIVIPGQNATASRTPQYFVDGQGRRRVRAFTNEATPGGAVAVYGWTTLKAGTFMYQSGSHSALQVQMGLYGGLTQDSGITEAYPGKTYSSSVNLFYSEIDPVLHNTVAAGNYSQTPGPGLTTSTIDYNPRYFLLNGTDVPVHSTTTGGGATLVRFFNAGYQNHVPVFMGLTMDMIAEDGNPYNYIKKQYSVLLAAGQTADAMITPAAGSYSFFDRMLNLTNKTQGGATVLALAANTTANTTKQTPGSLVSVLLVNDPTSDLDGDGVIDSQDNCTFAKNAGQQDSDNDGFGNMCDGDLDGKGTVVDFVDYAIFGASYGAVNGDANFKAAADFNSDGKVDFVDYSIFSGMYNKAPGPAGVVPL